jgi:23S rRNA (uracil1939-C5)-methyltransferase
MQPEFELTLQELVFGGDCIGRLPDGRAIFVPFGLPGEKVRIVLTEDKKSFAKGRILQILEPSPKRIDPRCRHFGDCGGCNYQHLPYSDQLIAKRQIVQQQLQRLAGLPDFPVAPVTPSLDDWNYRNTVQFHVTPAGCLGFKAAGSFQTVEISECHLPSVGISELWPQLDLGPDSGISRVQVREAPDGELLLAIESATDDPPEFTVDFPVSVVFTGPTTQFTLSGDDNILMQVRGRDFRVSAGSFFQANIHQAEAMVDHVLHLAGSVQGKTVLDAYCGVGLFSAFLAVEAKQLIGIEVSESSCNDFAINLDEFNNVDLYIDKVEYVLPTLKLKLDVAVIDPPRGGLDPHVIKALIDAVPKQIIYVSCDPATLARDIKRFLQGGYSLKSVTPFDQFPQTSHIETIALLESG